MICRLSPIEYLCYSNGCLFFYWLSYQKINASVFTSTWSIFIWNLGKVQVGVLADTSSQTRNEFHWLTKCTKKDSTANVSFFVHFFQSVKILLCFFTVRQYTYLYNSAIFI